MDNSLTDFLNFLESLHNEMKWTVTSVPRSALDWSPQPGQPSMCMLVSHTTGAERYWIGEVLGGERPFHHPGLVYKATGLDGKELCFCLDYALNHCFKVLKQCDLSDLEIKRISPRDGQVVAAGWTLEHVIEHTLGHQRDIASIRQLWVKRTYSLFYKPVNRDVQQTRPRQEIQLARVQQEAVRP